MNPRPGVIENRRHERIEVRLPVRYGRASLDKNAFAENISESGLYINTNQVFSVGTVLLMQVEFPQSTITQHGLVMWAIGVPEHMRDSMVCGMGIAFTALDPGWPTFFSNWMTSLRAGRPTS